MCGRFRERCGLYQLQKQRESDKDQEKCKIECGEFENIPTYPVRIVPGVLTECYKACKGRDQRADAADVDPDQKIGIVVRELREKNRRWHIAYDLTREGAEHKCVLFEQCGEEIPHRVNSPHVAREYEKEYECRKQRIIHVGKRLPIGNQKYGGNDHKPCLIGNAAKNDCD